MILQQDPPMLLYRRTFWAWHAIINTIRLCQTLLNMLLNFSPPSDLAFSWTVQAGYLIITVSNREES